MATVVGLRAADGVVLAADRTVVRGGSVHSQNRNRVYEYDGWALAVVGDDVDAVRDRIEVAVDTYRTDRDRTPGIEPLSRRASEVAAAFGTDLAVAGYDRGEEGDVSTDDGDSGGNGPARIAVCRADGSTVVDSPIALGSGAQLALGQIEAADPGSLPLEEATSLARETLASVSERDPKTGGEVDVVTLSDSEQ